MIDRASVALVLALVGIPVALAAQRGGPEGVQTPRAAAPIDVTGNWVSVVSEDWRWRMLTPQKGDYSSVPLNPDGIKAADAWNPASIAADGCKAFGAPAVMRVPGRLRVSWEDDATLEIEHSAGGQTRLLRFGVAGGAPGPRSLQGYSVATWETRGGGRAGGGLGVAPGATIPRVGSLKVVTTNLTAGYLRKNGVPHSQDAVVTEYFDRVTSTGSDWLVVLTLVEDPRYLTGPFVTSTHFKREADGSKWSPTGCDVAPPL